MRRKTQEEFINEMKERFGDKIDLSKVVYKQNKIKVDLKCNICGCEWSAKPNAILRPNTTGCPDCANKKRIQWNLNNSVLGKDEFVKRAVNIFGDLFDYSESEYINYNTKLKIRCNKCGNNFWLKPHDHLSMIGCKYCNSSTMESITWNYLQEHNISYEKEKRVDGCRGESGCMLPFDFYLPDYDIFIECQGQQHFVYKDFFNDGKLQERDKIKKKWCEDNNKFLYYINYNDNILEKLDKLFEEKLWLQRK